MMECSINQQLNNLFSKWKEALGCEHFTADGILLKLGQDEAQAETQWRQSPRRVAFLLKDNPAEWSDDVRLWLVDSKRGNDNRALKPKSLRKIAMLLYGLTHISEGRDVWAGEIAEADLVDTFNSVPFAIIETKKTPGTTSISDRALSAHIARCADFLQEEIKILNPNVIVCCGGPQHHFAVNYLWGEQTAWAYETTNVHRHAETGALIVYAPHPSNRASYGKYYEDVMYWVRKYLCENKNNV